MRLGIGQLGIGDWAIGGLRIGEAMGDHARSATCERRGSRKAEILEVPNHPAAGDKWASPIWGKKGEPI